MRDTVQFNLEALSHLRAGSNVIPVPIGNPTTRLRELLATDQKRLTRIFAQMRTAIVRLVPDEHSLASFLSRSTPQKMNPANVAEFYYRYLTYASVRTKDIHAGDYSVLMELSVSYGQARFLASLSLADIEKIAYHYPGALLEYCHIEVVERATNMHSAINAMFCFNGVAASVA
jgi:hypothetical protein